MSLRKIKIGIDVGGTFTHAVAIEVGQLALVGKACVPTTHTAEIGVAQGVIDALQALLASAEIAADEIVLIAHSTTQATNALLEGDVAPVGVIGLGEGFEGWRARSETHLKGLELAPGKILPLHHRFVDTARQTLDKNLVQKLIRELQAEGAEVIVASEAFGVDRPEREQLIAEAARDMGLLATAASDISKLYGLKVRTRTAVINASMMPRMLETANRTEQAIRDSGIQTPVMVMRSDGGIMSIDEMRRRPILTMLSGPAAGVAAALMFARVSDGIFIEVGGTSSDITVIRNGKPQVKSAQIGGHRLYIQTLDVRTLGIAGGSIPRIQRKGAQPVLDVGPRSAHIAGLAYPAFAEQTDFSDLEVSQIQPRPGDPSDYLKLSAQGKAYTLTPTEAAHYLDLVKVSGHGEANRAAVQQVMQAAAKKLQTTPEALATQIQVRAAEKIRPTIRQLMREYKLDRELIQFVGGGGGAMAIVPFAAQHLGFEHSITEHTEVISAIGAALGLIRDSVERNLINPSNDDLLSLRQAAYDSVLEMGAAPETIEVSIEIDTRNKKVMAVATGASALRTDAEAGENLLDDAALQSQAARSLHVNAETVSCLGRTERLSVWGATVTRRRLLGLWQQAQLNLRVLDQKGTVRLQLNDALAECTEIKALRKRLPRLVEQLTAFGDAGGLIPDVYLVLDRRLLDLSGLVEMAQMLALIEQETQGLKEDTPVVLLAVRKS
ncbi:MAG: hydantoinase [Candidatus Sericytochromatia bacterium]|nr:hydantoinase [Candidatus Sericytochromatia bacterium]